MPTYNYECQDCGYIKEITAGMSQIVLEAHCPSCGEGVSKFVRKFSPSTNFVLKGKGWAKDNYHKPDKKEEKGAKETKVFDKSGNDRN